MATTTNLLVSMVRTAVSDSYTVTVVDEILGCDTGSNEITLTLPAASDFNAGRRLIIKDEAGNASTNNIIITPNEGDLIDGDVSKTINGNYTGVIIYCNGTDGWFII